MSRFTPVCLLSLLVWVSCTSAGQHVAPRDAPERASPAPQDRPLQLLGAQGSGHQGVRPRGGLLHQPQSGSAPSSALAYNEAEPDDPAFQPTQFHAVTIRVDIHADSEAKKAELEAKTWIQYETQGQRRRRNGGESDASPQTCGGAPACEVALATGRYYIWAVRDGAATSCVNSLFPITRTRPVTLAEGPCLREDP